MSCLVFEVYADLGEEFLSDLNYGGAGAGLGGCCV